MMRLIVASLLILSGANAALAQSPATGMLLVATDELRDPRFSETVILLLHYGPDGALGVAINRPTWVDAAETFPDMPFLDDYTGRIYFGGPVAPANLVTLVRIPENDDFDLEPIIDDVYFSADPDFLNETVDSAYTEQALRAYAGHAGWEGGQLEREIAAGDWQVVPAGAEFIFSNEPLALWALLHAPQAELMVYWPGRSPEDRGALKSGVAGLAVRLLHQPQGQRQNHLSSLSERSFEPCCTRSAITWITSCLNSRTLFIPRDSSSASRVFFTGSCRRSAREPRSAGLTGLRAQFVIPTRFIEVEHDRTVFRSVLEQV
jgi:putative transcriptional regulator